SNNSELYSLFFFDFFDFSLGGLHLSEGRLDTRSGGGGILDSEPNFSSKGGGGRVGSVELLPPPNLITLKENTER
ncbi:hypothetical protein Ciccas_010140, partial [Cichlidogyrus casuarinus]